MENFITGMLLGLSAGMAVVILSPTVKSAVEKGIDKVKTQIKKIKAKAK